MAQAFPQFKPGRTSLRDAPVLPPDITVKTSPVGQAELAKEKPKSTMSKTAPGCRFLKQTGPMIVPPTHIALIVSEKMRFGMGKFKGEA